MVTEIFHCVLGGLCDLELPIEFGRRALVRLEVAPISNEAVAVMSCNGHPVTNVRRAGTCDASIVLGLEEALSGCGALVDLKDCRMRVIED